MLVNKLLYRNIMLSILVFPLSNIILFLLSGNAFELNDITFFYKQVALCFAIAVAEELFFRGLLLREMVFSYYWQPVRASLIVSTAFGILHLLNVNSYATWNYAIVQSVCAFAVSFNLCAIFINTKRLLWCVVIHAMINITSIGMECSVDGQQLLLSNLESIIFLSVSFIYLVSGIKMLNNKMLEGE